jgi:hypothetical protein
MSSKYSPSQSAIWILYFKDDSPGDQSPVKGHGNDVR